MTLFSIAPKYFEENYVSISNISVGSSEDAFDRLMFAIEDLYEFVEAKIDNNETARTSY